MSWIGDLERAFATNLYPLRVPIAIGLVVLLVAFVWFARRRGWFAAARRHPFRTGTLLAILLVVGIPTGWYLGSPLFIRTSLEEPAPSIAAVAQPTPTAAAPAPTTVTVGPTAPPAQTQPPLAAPRIGSFHGADDFHTGSGTATLVETAPGTYTVRLASFSVRNGPDLYVYVSSDADGYGSDPIELGPLKATDGNFNMAVPRGADLSGAKSVIIWCKQFAVLFAVAPLGG